MNQIDIKTAKEIEIMRVGGQKLGSIRDELEKNVVAGVTAWDIEELATKLIKEAGAAPSFKMVPGYSWSTCINTNDGVVHGIPKKEIVFKKGDLVSIDVGLFYKGFHTDTSTSVYIPGGNDEFASRFLGAGKQAINRAIEQAKLGNTVEDISRAMQDCITQAGYSPIRALTGHGVGRQLHEEPYIPCFVSGHKSYNKPLVEGMALAIEVMYSKGSPDLVLDQDGWTIRTKDGTISALFEETVAVTKDGPFILTKAN